MIEIDSGSDIKVSYSNVFWMFSGCEWSSLVCMIWSESHQYVFILHLSSSLFLLKMLCFSFRLAKLFITIRSQGLRSALIGLKGKYPSKALTFIKCGELLTFTRVSPTGSLNHFWERTRCAVLWANTIVISPEYKTRSVCFSSVVCREG